MDDSTLEDLFSYYVAFGPTTSASTGSVVSSSTESTSTGVASVAVSFGESSSLFTTYPVSSVNFVDRSSSVDTSTVPVVVSSSSSSSSAGIDTYMSSFMFSYIVSPSTESTTLSPSYTTSAVSVVSVPSGLSTTTSGGISRVTSPATTPAPSSATSTTNSSSHSISTGGTGALATTVTLPVDVYFDIPLNGWMGMQDTLFYWVSSSNISSLIANIEAGTWIHFDPEKGGYFHGFTLPILAGTTWFIHVTVEHPDNSASLFDIKIIVDERIGLNASSQAVIGPSGSIGANSTGPCRSQTASSSTTISGLASITATRNSSFDAANSLGFVGVVSDTTSTFTTMVATAAATGDTMKGAANGLNLVASSSSTTAPLATAAATEGTPIDAVSCLASNESFEMPLAQYLQDASTDEVSSFAVIPSLAGYNSDWIGFNTVNVAFHGVVPSDSPNVTLLVTAAVSSYSQNATYFLSVKLIITGQHPTALSSSSLFPLFSFASSSTAFAGWNYTATSTTRGIVPTPFYTGPGEIMQENNDTQRAWPSSQLSWNNTSLNASRTALPVPYGFGSGVGVLPPYSHTLNITATATTTDSMPSFTITLWTTATAYFAPCPTCPPQTTVVSVATGVTQIPVEVFLSYLPDKSPNATMTVTQSATESDVSTATSSDTDVVVVATLTRMVTVTTVESQSETSSAGSSRGVTVVTSTVSGDFITGRKSAAGLTGVSIGVLMSMPVLGLLGVYLLF